MYQSLQMWREMQRLDELLQNNKTTCFKCRHSQARAALEHHPEEAIKNNVFGTWMLHIVGTSWYERFVLISTDKALILPCQWAPQAYAEMIIQSE